MNDVRGNPRFIQPLIGYVVDMAGYAPAFVCVGVLYLLAIASLVAAGRIEPLR